MGGESAGVVSQYPSWLGQSGGAEMHQLTVEEMASHSHVSATFSGVDYTDTFTGLGNGSIAVGENYELGTSEESGGDQSHNNMQPYIALNYMVKVKDAFDIIGDLQSQIDSLSNFNESILIHEQWCFVSSSDSCYVDANTDIVYVNTIDPWIGTIGRGPIYLPDGLTFKKICVIGNEGNFGANIWARSSPDENYYKIQNSFSTEEASIFFRTPAGNWRQLD